MNDTKRARKQVERDSRSATELPEAFLQRLAQIFPTHYHELVSSFAQARPLSLRRNACLIDSKQAVAELQQLGIDFQQLAPFCDSYIIAPEQREQALASDYYQQGHFYAQGLASQLAVLALDPQHDEEVLDLCAAPGGKTAYISCLMQGSGRVAAVEQSKSRFFKLKNTLAWQQLDNVQAYHKDGIKVWRKVEERFDRVLLDAPCSSEARFRSGEAKSFQHWSVKKVKEMAKKQRALAYSAFHCLKPGGRLTYSTCSFAVEENEAVIDGLLQRFGDRLSVENIEFELPNLLPGITHWGNKSFHPDVSKALRVLPNEFMTGFFICNLRKNSG